jgi:hypothetical protein
VVSFFVVMMMMWSTVACWIGHIPGGLIDGVKIVGRPAPRQRDAHGTRQAPITGATRLSLAFVVCAL